MSAAVRVKVERPVSREGAARCFFCHDAVGTTGAWRCDACGVLVHPECARELARPACLTPGCSSARPWAWAEKPAAPPVLEPVHLRALSIAAGVSVVVGATALFWRLFA